MDVTADILSQVRAIQIRAKKQVADLLAGGYSSVFRGQGMEFDEIRAYVPGDDVRSIDWNVTARYNEPFVKRFKEEREMTVMMVVDLSRSGVFGSGEKSKRRALAELGAILAMSATGGGDKVGLIIFTDQIELYVPAKKGRQHVLRLIRELLAFKPKGTKTDIAVALRFLSKVQRKRCVTFVLSDFLDDGYTHELALAGRRHDLICIHITDEREEQLPSIGLIEFEDLETKQVCLVDTSSARVRSEFAKKAHIRKLETQKTCRDAQVARICVRADGSLIDPVVEFFHMRERRR